MIGDWVIPAWLFAIPGIGLAGFAYWFISRKFGWKVGLGAALSIIAAASAKAIRQKGIRDGIDDYERRQAAANEAAIDAADEARARADRDNADPERLRDDDGFRRD